MENNNEIQIQFVPIELLEYNNGQIPGVPENPRTRAYFDNTHDIMTNVWNIGRCKGNERLLCGKHASPKPIALCSRAIKSSSRENELVLDLFGGSGSTLIACEQLNRKCYMMELTEHYCDVIINRWEVLTGRKAIKIK